MTATPTTAAEKLRAALALWRGPPFADLDDSLARPERSELEERHASALEQRIDADLELGRHGEVVSELEALVREDPLRERRRAQLMLALYRSGRQADALDAYRSGRKLLADELGLEPGEELRQLEKAILEHDPAARRARSSPAARSDVRRRLAGRAAPGWRSRSARFCSQARSPRSLSRSPAAATPSPSCRTLWRPSTRRPAGSRPMCRSAGTRSRSRSAKVPSGSRTPTRRRSCGSTRKARTSTSIGARNRRRRRRGRLRLGLGRRRQWRTLTRIDPSQNAPEAPIDLGKIDELSPQPVFLVATGAGSVWITRGNKLMRIDPETNEARTWYTVNRPQGLAAGAGAVWVTQQDEHVLRIDATTPKITADEDLSELPQFPVQFDDSLWLIGYGDKGPHVWHLDSTTLTPQTAIPFSIAGFPYDLSGGSRALWTVGPNSGYLWRIDPATEQQTRLVWVAPHPISVAVGEGAVWVGVQAEPL